MSIKKIEIDDYIIYSNGNIYSKKKSKMIGVNPDAHGYRKVTLSLNSGVLRISVHRLIALLFVENPNPQSFDIINHIDGDKLNNDYRNLEWTDHYWNNKHAREMGLNNVSKSNSQRWNDDEFRRKTSKRMSEVAIKTGSNKGRRNPMFRYEIYKDDVLIDRDELTSLLNLSSSHTSYLIAQAAKGSYDYRLIENNVKVIDIKRES